MARDSAYNQQRSSADSLFIQVAIEKTGADSLFAPEVFKTFPGMQEFSLQHVIYLLKQVQPLGMHRLLCETCILVGRLSTLHLVMSFC